MVRWVWVLIKKNVSKRERQDNSCLHGTSYIQIIQTDYMLLELVNDVSFYSQGTIMVLNFSPGTGLKYIQYLCKLLSCP